MLVSVIVSTKNEERVIEKCLRSILDQTYKDFEIIVVDNNSTDKTQEIARRYTDKVYNKAPERSAQRNYGAFEKASGEYLLFIDADFILEKDLIRECVNKVKQNSGIIGLYVPLRWVGKNWIIKARGFEREFYDGTVLDAVRFINADAFKKIGGFDERLYAGEDWDLNKRLMESGDVDIINARFDHYEDENINLIDFIKKQDYYSRNMQVYIDKWGQNDSDIKKQFGLYYRFLGVFIEDGKWKNMIKQPATAAQ
ncbi:MAG: glycosyltransferase, partial [Nitrospirae bacterium]|nr:glycosyltransferase [Nitrospirota bacterium]